MFASIEGIMVVVCVAHKIIDILHKFEIMPLVLSIMDVNLTLVAFNLAILIVIVVVYGQNVFIHDINGNFITCNVGSCVDSCQSIKTVRIATIAIEFDGINLKTIELRDMQAISLLVNIVYIVLSGIIFCVIIFVVGIFRTLCAWIT